MALTKPSQDPTWAIDTSLLPYHCAGALESLSVLRREERKTIFVIFFFNFTVVKSRQQEKQD